MGTGSLQGVKQLGCGVDHPPLSSAKVKARVELYLYSPSGPSWPVLGWTILYFTACVCLGPVYDNEEENWRILTNKEIYASVRKPTIVKTIRLNRLHLFGHVQRMEENGIPKRVLYMNLGTTRLKGRPRNRWQDEVREDGRIIGRQGWQEKVQNSEEWKKLLRMARNHHILYRPMEWMCVCFVPVMLSPIPMTSLT